TAGASPPEFLVTEVVEELRRKHGSSVQEVHVVEEDVRFGLPRELEDFARAAGKTLPPRAGAVAVSGWAVRLVTFRRGRGEPKPGALWQEHVLDLGGLAKDLAVQRGTVRRGRGGFPRTILEIVQGSDAVRALVREAVEHGQRLVGQTAAEELAQRRLAYPLKRVRLLAPIPSPS